MSVQPAPAPLADARDAVEDQLRPRLAAIAPEVDLYVALLGVRDMLWREPTEPWHAELATLRGEVLPVYLSDTAVLVGPRRSAGTGPCFHCLARRWQQLRSTEERDPLESGRPVHAIGGPPALTPFTFEAVWQVVRQVAGTRPTDRVGHPYVHEVRLDTLAVRRYPIVADSHCPLCAEPQLDTAETARIRLASRAKPAVDDFRTRSVNDYPIDLAAYVNPVCGMAGIGAFPRLVSTTTAHARGHVGIRGGGMVHETHWGGHSDSYERSALLGIMEAHERIAGTQPRRIGRLLVDSYQNLRPDALDPTECGLYTEKLYASSPYYVPYRPDLPIPWVWGHSLRDDRPILVPAGITYYHLVNQRNKFVQECSNGCASGGCLEEAILYGLLELVERDAFLIAWYAKPRLTEIDPRSCTSARTRMMIDRVSMYGYDIRLFDTRIEFPIPVVTAVAQRRDGGPGTLLFAAGASLDPEEAIASGLYEIASEVADFGEDTTAQLDELRAKAADFGKVRWLADHATLYGLPEMARYADHLLAGPRQLRPMAEVYREWYARRPRTLDLRDDVQYCVDQVGKAGFDVIVVDQTSPEQREIGLHTASVIVPGLLPIDFGWNMQRALHLDRTRTVLRRVGMRETDLQPGELNLAPHPFP